VAEKTILANIVNEIMADNPTDAYRRAMAAVTPRKLWQAQPGDCVVMLAPCSGAFRDYVSETIGLDVSQVEIVAPSAVTGAHALEVAEELGKSHRITARAELKPFVLDGPVLDFGRRTGVRILPYTRLPDETTLDALRLINTKDGFRTIAASLGLPVADGGYAPTGGDLADALTGFLSTRPAAIIKTNRASNGYGNIVIAADAEQTVADQVRAAVADQPHRACGWVYEEFLPFTAAPSVEMSVDDAGVSDFYTCDQRTVNNAWRGMVTPAEDAPYLDDLRKAAASIGGWLHSRGYRGIFDVDCGVYEGGYVVTEANVRRTGGTYLEELARLLFPGLSPLHWRADVRLGTSAIDFAQAARRLTAAGLSDPAADVRGVLTADTLQTDGKWRYLVAGRSAAAVAAAEETVENILGIE
jgi:hypothetical protein